MTQSKRTVKWNESNLKQNKDYFSVHPIIYEISEPKTPFHHSNSLAPEEVQLLEESIPVEQNTNAKLPSLQQCDVMNDDEDFLSDTTSSMLQCEDSMSSNDGETWRFEENRLAHDTKIDMLQNSLSHVNSKTQDEVTENRVNERSEENINQKGKEIFEAMRRTVLEDERRKFKESKEHSFD